MSRKLEASLKKIDKVFDKMFKNSVAVSEKKERNSVRSYGTYRDLMVGLMRDVHREYGVADVSKIKEEHVSGLLDKRVAGFHSGKLSEASNAKTILSALKSFQKGVQETNVFSKKFQIADTTKLRSELNQKHVIRYGRASPVLRATPKEAESVLRNIATQGYQTETRQLTYHVSRISYETGGRIGAVLMLRAGDIRIDTKTGTISFIGDKGGKDNHVKISKESAAYVKKLADGKHPNQRIFTTKRKDGTFKSSAVVRKEIDSIVKAAGEHLTRSETIVIRDEDGNKKEVTVKRSFSFHSFRKSFAVSRVGEYLEKLKNPKAAKAYIDKRVSGNPILEKKLQEVKKRVNKHNHVKKTGSHGVLLQNGNPILKSGKTERELTREELAIFFTSVDLGHYRNDVITQFYTTFKEVESYVTETKKS